MTSKISDAELIERFLDGDERAFRTLYERHTPRLKMTLFRLIGGIDRQVEDLLQDTWLASCRSMPTFRGEASFFTWLTTIGVRVALAELRRRPLQETDLENATALALDGGPRDDARLDVERALARLPDRERVVTILHDLEGMTHERIGEFLGIAAGTSKATLSHARATLRAAFAKETTHDSRE